MKIVAFTGVYNEPDLLPRWLSHYGKIADDLFVIDSGSDDGSVEKAKEKFKFEVLHKEGHQPGRFIRHLLTKSREEIQNQIVEFLKEYDWVIYSHVDEFIFPDPERYTSIKDYIEKSDKGFFYCNGFDVVQDDEEPPIDTTKPILSQRQYWISTNSYSKPLVTKIPLLFEDGFHYLYGDPNFMDKREPYLYLAHVAKADKEWIKIRNPYRGDPTEFIKSENWGKREVIPERFKQIL